MLPEGVIGMPEHSSPMLMHPGTHKPFKHTFSAQELRLPDASEMMPLEVTPKQIGSTEFKWWADEVAGGLKSAVDHAASGNSSVSDKVGTGAEDAAISMITRRICRQLAKQIPGKVYGECVGSLRSKMKVVEDACGPANWDTLSVSSASAASEGYYTPSDTSTTGSAMSGAVTAALADILTRRVPLEISKYLAKEIFAQLVDEMREGSPDDENTPPQSTSSSMMGDGSHAAFPRVMTTPNLHQGPWDTNATQDTSCVTPPTGPPGMGNKCISDTSLFTSNTDTNSPFSGAHSVGEVVPATVLAIEPLAGENQADAAHVHRKFYHDNRDPALQMDAFKKFKLVLISGRGFRVVKHNHGGGRKTRVLKYNPAKNRIHWESSKMLGGEYIDCSKLVRVSREEAVTYVWHTSGPAGSRKMVGLETQREYDARVLELALLHMLNNPKAV